MQGLSVMQDQHKILSDALDTTQHQIPARGIYIPDDEEEYQSMY